MVNPRLAMREATRASRALSDEIRLRMLKLLVEQEVCVCEMKVIYSVSHSQISRKLKTLMDAGFLMRWNEGKCVVYVADRTGSSRYCRALIDILRDSFNDNEDVLRDREKLREVVAAKVREESR